MRIKGFCLYQTFGLRKVPQQHKTLKEAKLSVIELLRNNEIDTFLTLAKIKKNENGWVKFETKLVARLELCKIFSIDPLLYVF